MQNYLRCPNDPRGLGIDDDDDDDDVSLTANPGSHVNRAVHISEKRFINSQVKDERFTVHVTLSLNRSTEKMKLNEPGRQKFDGKSS